MSFPAAADNLLSGARSGIDAEVYWPGAGMVPVTELTLRRLLPLAAEGLDSFGVDQADSKRLLSIIEQRCLTSRNGATWQAESVRALQERGAASRYEALRLMSQEYIDRMHSNEPVHTWPVM
jgi:hypothetical protein